jgi:hypothetical protein
MVIKNHDLFFQINENPDRLVAMFPGLKGRYISAQGNALGKDIQKIKPCKGVT